MCLFALTTFLKASEVDFKVTMYIYYYEINMSHERLVVVDIIIDSLPSVNKYLE